MAASTEISVRRRIDWASAVMAGLTVATLAGALWYHARGAKEPGPLVVGADVPPLHLLDLNTQEPITLVGMRGKVVWINFWSVDSTAGRSSLVELQGVWPALKAHSRFALVTAAIEADQPDRVREAVAESGIGLPVYLATSETRKRFRCLTADPPLHVLVGARGEVVALARGADRPTIERFAKLAKRQLEELDPMGTTRFARAAAHH